MSHIFLYASFMDICLCGFNNEALCRGVRLESILRLFLCEENIKYYKWYDFDKSRAPLKCFVPLWSAFPRPPFLVSLPRFMWINLEGVSGSLSGVVPCKFVQGRLSLIHENKEAGVWLLSTSCLGDFRWRKLEATWFSLC